MSEGEITPAPHGDLHERPDGGFDGWCWDPARPQERLVVDLLVNDTPALSMVAAMFRRDLLALGCGDGRHGFSLRLPPHLVPTREECLITARERRTGAVFGRVLRSGGALAAPGAARVAAVAEDVAELWQSLAECETALAAPPAAAALRDMFGALAQRCAARARQAGVLEEVLPRGTLPAVADPALTVVLRAGSATATRRRIAALAPALAAATAELLVVDAGDDPACALLPAGLRNLLYLRDATARDPGTVLREAAAVGRGRVLLLLDAGPAVPSAAALLALARRIAATPGALLLTGPAAERAAHFAPVPAGDPPVRLPAPLGALIGGPRSLWRALGPVPPALAAETLLGAADLALRARLLGVPWTVVQEPPDSIAAPPPGAAALHAARQMHAHWSFAA